MSYFSSAANLYSRRMENVIAEENSLNDLINEGRRPPVLPQFVEGRITYVSEISTFTYSDNTNGMVQNYILTDDNAVRNELPIQTYRITAWNSQVLNRTFEKGSYYRLSNISWRRNTWPRRAANRCQFDIHLKRATHVEVIIM